MGRLASIRLQLLAAIVTALAWSSASPSEAASSPGVSPAESARVLATIRRRVQRFIAANEGIDSLRRVTTYERDPRSGRVLKTRVAIQRVAHHFYRPPSIKTYSCAVDGRREEPSECESRHARRLPHLPVFDRRGAKHYRVTIAGRQRLHGHLCYRVSVAARQQTERHFVGSMYFRVRDLQLLMLEGTVADLPWPLRKLYIKLHFRKLGPTLVDTPSGYLDLWLKVPIFYDRRFTIRYTGRDHRALPRRTRLSAREHR